MFENSHISAVAWMSDHFLPPPPPPRIYHKKQAEYQEC